MVISQNITMKCKYISPDINPIKCSRNRFQNSDFCIFHEPKVTVSHTYFLKFIAHLKQLHKNKDGNWLGFKFPKFMSINSLEIDYPINLQWAEVEDVFLEKVKFQQEVNLQKAIFKGEAKFQTVTFDESVNFSNTIFKSDTSFFAHFNNKATFSFCDFNNRVSFGGNFNDQCFLGQSTFRDSATFRGGRDIVLSIGNSNKNPQSTKVRRLFSSEVHMQDVDFRRPNRVKFIGVDLNNAHVVGTDMRGVHLYDVNFYQPSLKRQGIFDEIHLNNSSDLEYKNYINPRIEEGYRNIRVALEENKNYQSATDFYIGEMEIRRKRSSFLKKEFFSIAACYRALSFYGSSPVRSTRLFVWFLLLHLVSSIYITSNIITEDTVMLFQFGTLSSLFESFFKYTINSLRVLTLWRGTPLVGEGIWYSTLDSMFRIIGPLQLALIAMSMRTTIKRH